MHAAGNASVREAEADASAGWWGAELGLGDTLFKYIRENGGLFRNKRGEVFRRETGRWYRSIDGGRRFAAGMRMAVFKVEPEAASPAANGQS